MLRNYLKVAFRNIVRSKSYSLINILGLSLGVACCLLLTLYVQDELMFDRHHERLDDLYRITTTFNTEIAFENMSNVSPPIAMTVKDEVPEVEAAARVVNIPGLQSLIKYEDQRFYEPDGLVADSTVFDVLTYEFVEGSPEKALTDPNTVVITDRLAHKLFGNEPALDKMINISQASSTVNYKITAVIKDNPRTFLRANFFTSMMSEGLGSYLRSPEALTEWAGNNFVPSYLKLVPGADKEIVVKKINDVLQNHGAKSMEALGFKKTLGLEPVKDIYLRGFSAKSPRITYIYVISSIAIFILVIACINFMNLSTARATKRANEIGLRKVMGAFRSSLIGQIMGEALVIVSISMIVSVIVVQLALPFFNDITAKSISFGSENILYFIGAITAFTIITGLLAGSYPALYLSSFQPAQVLKGKFNVGNASGWLRRSLVVVQFMIAITLVCGMIIISEQLEFMRDKNLGFDAKAKIFVPLRTATAKSSYPTLQTELIKTGVVKEISAADYLPGNPIFNDMFFYMDGGNMNTAIDIRTNTVDYHYQDLLDIKLIAGRKFTDNYKMEDGKLILNETAVKRFGITPDKMVGEKLHFEWHGESSHFEVIGVIEDYHQNTLKEEIKPMLFQMTKDAKEFNFMISTIDANNLTATIARLQETWNKVVGDTPFEYSLLDQSLQKQYDEDKRISRIISYFTIIAMLISCLGLYGLSTYMAERRFKEIGIRKVLGASISQIVALMSTEFIKLVLIAFVISVPIAWYSMSRWLDGFAYKISVNLWVFVYAGLAALVIALLTVSFESIKAASTNPVKALRSE